jgi:hypothetical protein
VGTSLGFGERSDLMNPNIVTPGVGTYDLRNDASENINPAWK